MDNEFRSVTPFASGTKIYEASAEDTSFLGFIEGYAATSFKDRYEEIITDKALKNGASDLLKHSTVFVDHDYRTEKSVGKVLESNFVKDEGISGIYVKVGISKVETDLWTKIQEGIVKAFSIGGLWKDYEYDKDTDTGMINDIELWEVSVVGLPANPTALFGNLAMKFIKSMKETTETDEVPEEKEKEVIEVKKMVDEPEYRQKMLEMDEKLNAFKEEQSDAVGKMADAIGTLSEALQPVLEEKKKSRELAERQSVLVQEAEERFSQLPYHKQLRANMQNIIRTIQDSSVDDTVLMGSDQWTPSVYYTDYDESVKQKQRLGL